MMLLLILAPIHLVHLARHQGELISRLVMMLLLISAPNLLAQHQRQEEGAHVHKNSLMQYS